MSQPVNPVHLCITTLRLVNTNSMEEWVNHSRQCELEHCPVYDEDDFIKTGWVDQAAEFDAGIEDFNPLLAETEGDDTLFQPGVLAPHLEALAQRYGYPVAQVRIVVLDFDFDEVNALHNERTGRTRSEA